jgi:hypothetical protein
VPRPLPRFVIAKPVAGRERYYWTLPSYYRKQGCTLHLEHDTRLGADYAKACGEDGKGGTAAILNTLFDEWDEARLGAPPQTMPEDVAAGSVDWLFRTYKASNDWKEKVSDRTAPDHENTIALICELKGQSGIRIGSRPVTAITPEVADTLYELVRSTPTRKGKKARPRTAEKVVAISRHAWKVVRRLHPGLFNSDVWNPWEGVAMKRRRKLTKPAATRDDVYAFAWGAVAAGHFDAAAAAVICFEWLQRPENVLAGYVSWNDYRGANTPNQIRIEHHKTGEMVLHPLEETVGKVRTLFYEEAEEILSHVPRLGLGIVMRDRQKTRGRRDKAATKWDIMSMGRLVRALRDQLELPDFFTLDSCRHGGMTELEEAELTDGQGRALSAHRSKAYEGYAKRTEKRALAATRKRHAHKVALEKQAEAEPEVASQNPVAGNGSGP